MITERDLEEAIAECLGRKNPDASTCIKLAAFYTIRQELYPSDEIERVSAYSYAAGPEKDETVIIGSNSEFARAIDGRKQDEVWPVIDEMMEILKAVYPRLYNAVLAKF